MHLIKPKGRKLTRDIRFRNHDGKTVKVSGDRDRATAMRLGEKIMMLVKAKQAGDPPPAELMPWIANMPASLSARLVALGLIGTRHVERDKPLSTWIEPWAKVIQNKHPTSLDHAPQQESKVRRIINSLNAAVLGDLDADRVTEAVNGFKTVGTKRPKLLAVSSRRSYLIAVQCFTLWVAKKLKVDDPLADLPLPSATEDIEYERQPLTVKQFRALIAHLGTFERYFNQKSRWTAFDRKMIYWTAVKTGYRQKELKKLRVWNLHLDEKPAVISLKARDNKNRVKGEVPIPSDLAKALRSYIADLAPDDVVFPFPGTSGSIVDMLRRDLDEAKIPWRLPSGEVIDFHTLRSTCITWWLDEEGLKPKRVQILARLKTLALVANYSRNLRLTEFDWLDKGPKLVEVSHRKSA